MPRAQALQWFLSEADWDERKVQESRLQRLREDPTTAPTSKGVLVIDETGDRKDGHKTAHVGRQYLGKLGKVDNGVVSGTRLGADEAVYYPIDVEPYTPAHHFEQGEDDPAFRTNLTIALDLVERASTQDLPFRAVVADNFYGEDRTLRQGFRVLKLGYVLALKPSHDWWHRAGTPGSLREVAQATGWKNTEQPGQWVGITRTFRDGSTQDWWALEIVAGPYGPDKTERAVVATTDPQTLPDLTTWDLVTNLPAPASSPMPEHQLAEACLEEAKEAPEPPASQKPEGAVDVAAPGEKNQHSNRISSTSVLASGAASRARVAGALDHAAASLSSVVRAASPTSAPALA